MGMVEYITDSGFDLLNRMLSGESKIKFTRVEMGDGYPSELNYKKVKALAKPIVSLDVESVRVSENKTVKIAAIFDNTRLAEGFYYREKGIYATDGEKEILFSYANAREDAGFIDPPTVCMVEKKIISYMTQLQGTDGEVKIDVKSGIYVSTDDFVYYMSTSVPEYSVPEYDELNDYAIKDKDNMSDILGKARYLLGLLIEHILDFGNPHKVSKGDVGLENVSNVTTNNQTPTFTEASTRVNISSGEKLSIILGKISKVFSDLKAIAFSGSYNDLTDKPSIPAAVAVKGNAESLYRTGNVNITKADIGLGNVENTADADKSVKNAMSATKDGNGNVIANTYALKESVPVYKRYILSSDNKLITTLRDNIGDMLSFVDDSVPIRPATIVFSQTWILVGSIDYYLNNFSFVAFKERGGSKMYSGYCNKNKTYAIYEHNGTSNTDV